MYLLNKPKSFLLKKINKFLIKHSLSIDDEFCDRLLYLLQGCSDGTYKWQNLEKNCLLPIIKRKLPGDLREFYINHLSIDAKMSLHKMTNLYGEAEGNSRWESYCKTQAETNTFEYKNKKYGMTADEFLAYNKSRAVTLDNCIARHGEIDGTKIFDDYCKTQAYVGISLEYFIEKLGIDLGTEKHKEVCKSHAITLGNMIRLHGELLGTEKYHTWKSSKVSTGCKFVSPVSQELFKEIESRLDFDVNSMYSYKNKEFGFYDKHDMKSYFYDYVIMDLKLCIEFNGDLYHANPEIYSPSHVFGYPYFGLSSTDIWDRDTIKNNKIKERGYEVIIVWEYDYRNDKEGTILKCVEYINELYDREMQSQIIRDTRDRCV